MSKFKAGEIVLCLADSSCGGFTAGKLYGVIENPEAVDWVKMYDNNNRYNGWSTAAFRTLTNEEYSTALDAEVEKGDEVMVLHSVDFPSFLRYEAWGVNEEEFPKTVSLATDGVYVGDTPRYTVVKTEFGLQGEEKQKALPVWDKGEVEEVVDTMVEDVVSLEDAPEVEGDEKQYITDPTILKVGDYVYLEEGVEFHDNKFGEGLYKVTDINGEDMVDLDHTYILKGALAKGYLVEVDIKPIKREKPVASYRAEDYIIVEENGAYKVYERKA